MRVLSVIATKGGVGKTTITANIGGLFADAGLRVLLLDLDSQPTLSSYYALRRSAPGGAYDLIAHNQTNSEQIISRTRWDRLDLIMSNDSHGQLGTLLLHAADGRLRLRNLLSAFAADYDLLLIDTQGARSVVLEMALLASDLALSPILPEMLAARELRRGTLALYDDLHPFSRLGIMPPPLHLVLNQVNFRRTDTRMIVQSLRKTFANHSTVHLLRTEIPNRVAYLNAATRGVPVHHLDYRRQAGQTAPCALETLQALAMELLPEWRHALSTLGLPEEQSIWT
jgi:chromosome partitioning related protein ParA